MRLLYFHQHFSTPNGAAGTRSYEMARRCIAEGHEVIMVCGSYKGGNTGLTGSFENGKRRGWVDGIDVIEFELSYSNNDNFLKRTYLFFLYAIKSVFIALTYKYDVLFATTTPLTASIPGIFAKWLRRKQFVFEVRDLWPELPKAMGVIKNPLILTMMSILEWLSYKSADRLIGLSPGICEGIIKRGIPSNRVVQISNGCDIELFNANVEKWRPDNVSNEDVLFIYSGTHGIANGLHAVLDAEKELNNKNITGYKIVLIGQGKEKNSLIEKSSKLQLRNIIFLDPVPKQKLIGLLRSSNVGLQILDNVPAFYFGTSPNKFFDYLAVGLPVLTNYPGWVADLIEENKCGFVVPPSAPSAFASAIIDVIEKKDKLCLYGENSSKLALKEFDRNSLSKKWVEWVFNNLEK